MKTAFYENIYSWNKIFSEEPVDKIDNMGGRKGYSSTYTYHDLKVVEEAARFDWLKTNLCLYVPGSLVTS